MKGQVHLMEYVLLGFFIVLIIVLVTLFLTGWQITSVQSEQRRVVYDRAEFFLRALVNSPYLNKKTFKEGSMLEDSKLTSVTCEDLQKLYGRGWFAEINSLNLEGECTEESYPSCGSWSYCKKEGEAIVFEIPVNIYRKTTGEIDIGILKVGLYSG